MTEKLIANLVNWKTQIKKGYLEICILSIIKTENKIYGFDLIEKLKSQNLEVKEGTLYPLLNRMTDDKILSSFWETENAKGHPRKFYSLTAHGENTLREMTLEFENMIEIFNKLKRS